MPGALKKLIFLLILLGLGGAVAYLAISFFLPGGSGQPTTLEYVPDFADGTKARTITEDEFDETTSLQELTEIAEPTSEDKPLPQIKEADAKAKRAWLQEGEHTIGNKKAKVAMFYYADLSDMLSRALYKRVREFANKNKKNVVFVFRHYALVEKPYSHEAATATECAVIQKDGKQDIFWKLTDAIYKDGLRSATQLYIITEQLGLDNDKLKECVADEKVKLIPSYYKTQALRHEVIGAPTVVFQKAKTFETSVISGISSVDYMQETLNQLLK